MKVFLAYVFLFIFSFQVLPVKELGQLLFKGQMTEEIHETNPTPAEDDTKLKKEAFFYSSSSDHTARNLYLGKKIHTAIHEVDYLPDYHVPDVITPPPNFI